MRYIIMCGGEYKKWETPRHLVKINGEVLVNRTIRLLQEAGVSDIVISVSNEEQYKQLRRVVGDSIAILTKHDNDYTAYEYNKCDGYWCDAFIRQVFPACYIFGDVVFSKDAINTIVNTITDDIEFFASAPPFDKRFSKDSAEPFAFKVVDTIHFNNAIEVTKRLCDNGAFKRHPIAWELWQVIKRTPINEINYNNYTVINDYTCDIDNPEDVKKFEGAEL